MGVTVAHQRAIISAAIELAKKRIRLSEIERECVAEDLTAGEGLRRMMQAGIDVDHAVTVLTNAVVEANIAHIAEGN